MAPAMVAVLRSTFTELLKLIGPSNVAIPPTVNPRFISTVLAELLIKLPFTISVSPPAGMSEKAEVPEFTVMEATVVGPPVSTPISEMGLANVTAEEDVGALFDQLISLIHDESFPPSVQVVWAKAEQLDNNNSRAKRKLDDFITLE